MLPPLDDDAFLKFIDLSKLTSGVHSSEALEMVRDHLMAALGPEAANSWPNQMVRMSKPKRRKCTRRRLCLGIS